MATWVEGMRFGLEHLPYCRFRHGDTERLGVGIGDAVLDLYALAERDLIALPGMMNRTLNELAGSGRGPYLREQLQRFLAVGQTPHPELLHHNVELLLPFEVGDYTDFYASKHHATRVGSMFRPDNPLLPNYEHVPIAYHGRSSTLVVSGTPVPRPSGQTKADDQERPVFGPSKSLDYELEMGFYLSDSRTIFGFSLLNDWSARDLQRWEYQPLGPFLAKSFCTSVSAWVTPWEALLPYRCPPEPREPVLEYLQETEDYGFDIRLEVWLNGEQLSKTNFKHMYWTVTQMLTHHASNGCVMRAGDLLASGTVSGPEPSEGGCLLELGWAGPGQPRTRGFLQDGDEVILRGYCEKPGLPRLELGECAGVVK